MNEPRILRAAPEPKATAFTAAEAIGAAKTAFAAARRAQLALLAGHLNAMLFDPGMVNYRRLRSLRYTARQQVEQAIEVEQLIAQAVEAFEATR
jgi:hypothetical protein